jgi:hypothetical protein
MRFAAACHTEMAMQLAVLRAAVSSATQPVLGRLPTEAFQADVMGVMLAHFWEQVERCLRLENSSSRVCNLTLGPAHDRVQLTICLEEAIGQLQAMQEDHREAVVELRAL